MTQEQVPPPAAKDQIAVELGRIVDRFNKEFTEWSERTGCVVNFGWKYGQGKHLEIQGIDFIVYRKDAPTAQNLAAVMKAYEPKDPA